MAARETGFGQGAMQGAAAGSAAGPWGAAIGAGVGGILGYVGASDQEAKAKKAHKAQEEFRRQQNKYAAFFGRQPTMERARAEQSAVPGLMSGITQGAQMGGMIGNMYGQQPPSQQRARFTNPPPSQFNPQTGEPVAQNFYA